MGLSRHLAKDALCKLLSLISLLHKATSTKTGFWSRDHYLYSTDSQLYLLLKIPFISWANKRKVTEFPPKIKQTIWIHSCKRQSYSHTNVWRKKNMKSKTWKKKHESKNILVLSSCLLSWFIQTVPSLLWLWQLLLLWNLKWKSIL